MRSPFIPEGKSVRQTMLMTYLRKIFHALFVAAALPLQAQDDAGTLRVFDKVEYGVEAQVSASSGKTPLWLNANRHGLSSLEEVNGYLRGSIGRSIAHDSLRRWGVGYGADVAVPLHYTSDVVIQQAFVEGRWLHGTLSVGSKEYPMQLKNNRLSSGAQTLGINARPVPQVRLALADYWTVPKTNGWLHLKGHLAYGMMTDEHWQHDFTHREQDYADGLLYHSKAGYLKIGKENCYYPLSLELGVEMATIFSGKAYVRQLDGSMACYEGEKGALAFWHALKPDGGDPGETTYTNAAGDMLGSLVARVNYDADTWRLSVYADRFFEDHSAMLFVDYDGYGEGSEWQQKKKNRYLIYDLKDIMLGVELHLKYGEWLRHVLLEYIYTKYQSGPIYHDHTAALSDHIGGVDNYYNHYIYPGWQHWGQVMGNPLYRSPLYNDDGTIYMADTRFKALHLGLDGSIRDVDYRLLATVQEGVGTYRKPFTKPHHNVSVMAEGAYKVRRGWLSGWSVRGAVGVDLGGLLGHNYGMQLTLSRHGLLNP